MSYRLLKRFSCCLSYMCVCVWGGWPYLSWVWLRYRWIDFGKWKCDVHDFSVVFSVIIIMDKCPSLASNPIDTSTLALTSLHIQYSDMPAHINSIF